MTPYGFGYTNGAIIAPAGGSLSPSTFDGATISALITNGVVDSPLIITQINIAGSRAQDFFTTITINGSPLQSADAIAHFEAVGQTIWLWSANLIPVTGTYEVTIA